MMLIRVYPVALMLPWFAHLYTGLGVVAALAATLAVFRSDYRAAFLWLGLQILIDSTDGMLARALRVKERLPNFDGAKLDDIIDYLTYAFIPVLLTIHAGLVPASAGMWVGAVVLLASGYGFSQTASEGADVGLLLHRLSVILEPRGRLPVPARTVPGHERRHSSRVCRSRLRSSSLRVPVENRNAQRRHERDGRRVGTHARLAGVAASHALHDGDRHLAGLPDLLLRAVVLARPAIAPRRRDRPDACALGTALSTPAPGTSVLSPLVIIFLTVFIDLLGFGIIVPLLPFYAESFGASALTVGLLGTVFSLMQFVVAPLCGRWSDRVGRRPVILYGLLASAVAYVALALADSLALVFAARILGGIAGGNIPTAQAYIADITTPENRAKGMGLVGAAFGLGFIFGPAIGGILARFGHSTPMWFAAALCFGNFLAALMLLPESRHGAADRVTLGRLDLFRRARRHPGLMLLLLVFFLVSTAFSGFEATFALFTERRFGFTAETIGYIFAFIGVVLATVNGLLVGRVVPVLGERRIIPGALALIGVGLLLVPAAEQRAHPLCGVRHDRCGDGVQQSLAHLRGVSALGSRRAGRHARAGAVARGARPHRRTRLGRLPLRPLRLDDAVRQRGVHHVRRVPARDRRREAIAPRVRSRPQRHGDTEKRSHESTKFTKHNGSDGAGR